jgi:hypothetical protein
MIRAEKEDYDVLIRLMKEMPDRESKAFLLQCFISGFGPIADEYGNEIISILK